MNTMTASAPHTSIDAAALLAGTTPGPWTLHEDLPRQFGDEKTGWTDHGGFRVDAHQIEQLAYVWNDSRRIPLEGPQDSGPPFGSASAAPNARLIAAAPDLAARVLELEAALAGLLDAISDLSDDARTEFGGEDDAVVVAANAALRGAP